MLKQKNNKSKNPNDWNLWKTIQVINIIALLILGVFAYTQNEKINKLSRGSLRNDILISSTGEDTIQKMGKTLSLPIKVDSNFEGKIPAHIELLEIRNSENKKITSDYELIWISKQLAHIGIGESTTFYSNLTISKKGTYSLKFRVNYNYNTEKGFENGETEIKDYEFSMIFD